MEDNSVDVNPFASPQSDVVAEAVVETSELFRLTVHDATKREWSQVGIAISMFLVLGLLLGLVTSQIATPQPLQVVVPLWLTGILAIGALLKAGYHLRAAGRVHEFLPIRLTVDGIEARAEVNGRFRSIQWPWYEVAKLRLVRRRWLEVHARSGDVAICYLRDLSRTDFQALRAATRKIGG